jgi:hypothetical protein
MEEKLIPYIHKACRGIALYKRGEHPWVAFEQILASDVVHADLTAATPFEQVVCGSCGKPFDLVHDAYPVLNDSDQRCHS